MRCHLQGKSFKHVDSSMIPRGGSKAIYQSCGESLRSGDPTTGSPCMYKGCGESFRGVEPSMIHCSASTPLHGLQ